MAADKNKYKKRIEIIIHFKYCLFKSTGGLNMKKSFINAVAVGTSLMTIAITPVAVIETFTSSTTVHADSEQSIKNIYKS